MKLTKQGVRDLNHIKGKSVGRKLDPLPVPAACKHKHVREVSAIPGYVTCEDCGVSYDAWEDR